MIFINCISKAAYLVYVYYITLYSKVRDLKPMQLWTFPYCFCDQFDDGYILAETCSLLCLGNKSLCLDWICCYAFSSVMFLGPRIYSVRFCEYYRRILINYVGFFIVWFIQITLINAKLCFGAGSAPVLRIASKTWTLLRSLTTGP